MYFFLLCTQLLLFPLNLEVIAAARLIPIVSQSSFNESIQPALPNQTDPNIYLTNADNITSATFGTAPLSPSSEKIAPLSDFIPFKVPDTQMVMSFHSFGDELPNKEVILTITPAVAVVLKRCRDGMGGVRPILGGFFRYQQEFPNGDLMTFSLGDFREEGHPMTYFMVADTLKGIIDFMKQPDQNWTEVSFEVEEGKHGYVGSGSLSRGYYSPSPERLAD